MSTDSLSDLTERWMQHCISQKLDLRAKLIDACAKHEGWEESAVAMVDAAIMPVIRQYEADVLHAYDGKCGANNRLHDAASGDVRQSRISLIEKLEAKWKPPGIGCGSPLVRLDDVTAIIRQHGATCKEDLQVRPSEIRLTEPTAVTVHAGPEPKPISGMVDDIMLLALLDDKAHDIEPECDDGYSTGYRVVTCKVALDVLRPYLRTTEPKSEPERCKHGVWPYDHCYDCEREPKPVSVDGIAGRIEIDPPYSPTDEYYITVIKSVLDAIGVKYVD